MLPRLVLFTILASSLGLACSCADPEPKPCQWGKPGNIAFVGTVLSVNNPASEDDRGHIHDDGSGEAHYRFHIDEAFFGVKGPEIDIYSGRGGGDCSYHFKAGEQYLVVPFKSNGKLFATFCNETRAYHADDPLILQFRAVRDHQPVASVFGTLKKDNYAFVDDGAPLNGVTIRFADVSSSRKFETITDAVGIYQIRDLPPGKYKVVAELPSARELRMMRIHSAPTLEFSAGACFELGLQALPAARIRGRLNEKGEVIHGSVELLSGSSYVAGSSGPWEISGKDGFEFENVPDGSYILVFNKDNELDPDAPYPRTFYPGVIDPGKAVPIAVEGERVITADIHLSGGTQVHHLAVTVTWANSSPVKEDMLSLFAQPAQGREPTDTQQIGPGVFRLNLLHGQRYIIKANLYCGERCVQNACRGFSIDTPTTEFDVPSTPSSSLRLAFTVNECPK